MCCADRLGGVTPFSSVDWPGRLSAVVFVQGCPWRCAYCHNPHLQPTAGRLSWPGVAGWLAQRRGLLDAVVFSGGEPLLAGALPQWLAQVRAMGFQTGLHTAGIYPERLRGALSQLDWVGLDIKTLPDRYERLTGVAGSASQAWASLDILLASQVAMECRTTWHPGWLAPEALLELAQALAGRGVRRYAVQQARDPQTRAPGPALPSGIRQALGRLFEHFEDRSFAH